MERALTTAINTAEMEDVTIANLMCMVEFETAKIVVLGAYKLNNKYALEPMRYAAA